MYLLRIHSDKKTLQSFFLFWAAIVYCTPRPYIVCKCLVGGSEHLTSENCCQILEALIDQVRQFRKT
jgi:hypothetical protein